MPDVIPRPDIMGDYPIWRETHWTEQQIHTQPDTWLTKILMAHGEDNRIQSELYDPQNRVDEARGRTISDGEIASMRRENPNYVGVPDAAIRHLHGDKKKR